MKTMQGFFYSLKLKKQPKLTASNITNYMFPLKRD